VRRHVQALRDLKDFSALHGYGHGGSPVGQGGIFDQQIEHLAFTF
jgi:hypothetical protein